MPFPRKLTFSLSISLCLSLVLRQYHFLPPLEQISRAPFSILDSPSRIDGKFLKEKQLSNPFFKKVLVKNLYLSALALISRLTGGILR